MADLRRLPLSTVTLVFGLLSIPLAFARQLCVPAFLMGVLAILFHVLGLALQKRNGYTTGSIKLSLWGMRLAVAGSACALAMYFLWLGGVLF